MSDTPWRNYSLTHSCVMKLKQRRSIPSQLICMLSVPARHVVYSIFLLQGRLTITSYRKNQVETAQNTWETDRLHAQLRSFAERIITLPYLAQVDRLIDVCNLHLD